MKVRGVKKVRQQAQETERMLASPCLAIQPLPWLLPLAAAAVRGCALAETSCNWIRLESCVLCCCA